MCDGMIMEDWKKHDCDFIPYPTLLPWGCTLRNYPYRIIDSREVKKKEEIHVARTIGIKEKMDPIESNIQKNSGDNDLSETAENTQTDFPEQSNIKITSLALAKILGKSVRTIQRMALDGRLPVSREADSLVWMRKDLKGVLNL